MMSRYRTILCTLVLLAALITIAFLLYGDGFMKSKSGLSGGSNQKVNAELQDIHKARRTQHPRSNPTQYRAPVGNDKTINSRQKFAFKQGTVFGDSSINSEMRCPQLIQPNMILPCDSESDPICTQYLLPADYFWLRNTTEKFQNFPYGECRFMNGTNRAPVALVSFPGSGNTWVRGLLEQATGICTGECYTSPTFNYLSAMGTFMCPYKIEKTYFILTPNIKRPV